jgi:hypothetical protein
MQATLTKIKDLRFLRLFCINRFRKELGGDGPCWEKESEREREREKEERERDREIERERKREREKKRKRET